MLGAVQFVSRLKAYIINITGNVIWQEKRRIQAGN